MKKMFVLLLLVTLTGFQTVSSDNEAHPTHHTPIKADNSRFSQRSDYFSRLFSTGEIISHSRQEQSILSDSAVRQELFRAFHSFTLESISDSIQPFLIGEKESGLHYLRGATGEGAGAYRDDEDTCRNDTALYFAAVKNVEMWALQMADATGKPRAGVLRGNIRSLGDFDECVATQTGQPFGPRYCLSKITITKIRQQILAQPLTLQFGLCVPDSCNNRNLVKPLQQLLNERLANVTATVTSIVCQDTDLPFSNGARIVIGVLTLIGSLMAVASAYDILCVQGVWKSIRYGGEEDRGGDLANHHSESEPLIYKPKKPNTGYEGLGSRMLLSFSFYTNTKKLLTTSSTSNSIDCIMGIRFLSMTWVILGHALVFSLDFEDNVMGYVQLSTGRWTFQVILNALISVDTFFALSGLLMVYLVMKELQKSGPSPGFFSNMYFHRFWRLTPPYMLILMAYAVLFKYVGDGPMWRQSLIQRTEDCGDSWWTNLLYINNFVKIDNMCMSWTWYMPNDMQFFLISPVVFVPLFYLGYKGLVVPLLLLVGNALASGIITNAYDLPPTISMTNFDYHKMYYLKPYTRIGPYLVGMITGYFLYRHGCKARMSRTTVFLGWTLATAVGLAVQYGLYEHFNGHPLTSQVSAVFNSLHRIGWAMAVCWVIYACANGYGGYVNTLLSWKALVPLSRLTYCVYLVHPIIIMFHASSQRKATYLDNNNLVFSYLAYLVMSNMLGYVASMAFEAPMIGLEKAFKKKLS